MHDVQTLIDALLRDADRALADLEAAKQRRDRILADLRSPGQKITCHAACPSAEKHTLCPRGTRVMAAELVHEKAAVLQATRVALGRVLAWSKGVSASTIDAFYRGRDYQDRHGRQSQCRCCCHNRIGTRY